MSFSYVLCDGRPVGFFGTGGNLKVNTRSWEIRVRYMIYILIIPRLVNPFRMVCIAIAAKRMPTTRDITVEIVKLINFDPQAAA